MIGSAREANPVALGVAADGASSQGRNREALFGASDNGTLSWNWTLGKVRLRRTFPLGCFSFLQLYRTEENISLARPARVRKGRRCSGLCVVGSSLELESGGPDSGPSSGSYQLRG